MEERKVGLVLAGCGGIGRSHAAAIVSLPEAKLIATVDVDEERASAFKEQFGAEISSTDLAEVLTREALTPSL